MIRGPKEYVPPVEVEVLMKRVAIPLDENEGIYVRDIKTGKVRPKTTSSICCEDLFNEHDFSKNFILACL